MPSITTLIPAYKKEFLGEMFMGLARQSFRDFIVILSDDSPDEEITALIRSGQFDSQLRGLNLHVVRGPRNGRLNHQALIELWNGSTPYVHLQLDDDVIFPDFYSSHLEAHASGDFCASVSQRWSAQSDNQPAAGFSIPRFIIESPLRVLPVECQTLCETMVPNCANWMGEFSNMLLSAEGASHWPRASATEMNYYGWMDVGFLLSASKNLPVAFLRDHLSIFRQHAGQSTHHVRNHSGRVGQLAWASYALQAWTEQRISHHQAAQAVCMTVSRCLQLFDESDPVLNRFYDLVQLHGQRLDKLYSAFKPFWLALLACHPSTAPAAAAVDQWPLPAEHVTMAF